MIREKIDSHTSYLTNSLTTDEKIILLANSYKQSVVHTNIPKNAKSNSNPYKSGHVKLITEEMQRTQINKK